MVQLVCDCTERSTLVKITITLPMNHPETTIRDLLEKEWLVPRKVRHFCVYVKRLDQSTTCFVPS